MTYQLNMNLLDDEDHRQQNPNPWSPYTYEDEDDYVETEQNPNPFSSNKRTTSNLESSDLNDDEKDFLDDIMSYVNRMTTNKTNPFNMYTTNGIDVQPIGSGMFDQFNNPSFNELIKRMQKNPVNSSNDNSQAAKKQITMTEYMELNAKDCPACGARPHVITFGVSKVMSCSNCMFGILINLQSSDDSKEAVARWNEQPNIDDFFNLLNKGK